MEPDSHTISETFVEVSDGHTLYVQDWGRQDATTPIIFLHGGPGSGLRERHKQPFDPTLQRVLFFDQRGSGKSLPHGSLEHNTTQDSVEDISKIADHFGIKRFILTGNSWGSCLSLAYALAHPERVLALVISGIFTGSQREIDYLDKGHFATHFPDVWDRYLAATPPAHRSNPSRYHMPRILGTDEQAAKASAYAYGNVEGALLSLDDRFTPPSFDDYDPTLSKLEAHYMTNRCFMPDRFILDNAHKLRMPVWLAQGRYDMVCPPQTAYELHHKLPHSHLLWAVSGHRAEHEITNLMHTIFTQLTSD